MLESPPSSPQPPIAPPRSAQPHYSASLALALVASVDCQRCNLSRTRHSIVAGEGDPEAVLAFVGEAPGREEDVTGQPFVGAIGKLLDRMLVAMSRQGQRELSRTSGVFLLNVCQCRPPQNRAPLPSEVTACEGYLWQTLAALPRLQVIVALGNVPLRLFSGNPLARIAVERGQWFERVEGGRVLRIMPTLALVNLLQSPAEKMKVWEDLQMVVKEL